MMADDWQPGDLALCVDDGPSRHEGSFKPLRRGSFYIVSGLWQSGAGLHLHGVPEPDFAPFGWASRRFRKIRPHTPDAEDAETIRLLTGAPVREPVA